MNKQVVVADRVPVVRIVMLALVLWTLAGSACGVDLGAEQTRTEIFHSVAVTNDQGGSELTKGAMLTLRLEYEQPYPAQLDIECDLMSAGGGTKVSDIHVEAIPANGLENIPTSIVKSYKDEVTAIAGSIEQPFAAPDLPGTYVVRCFTQEDDNNEIERTIIVAEGAPPS